MSDTQNNRFVADEDDIEPMGVVESSENLETEEQRRSNKAHAEMMEAVLDKNGDEADEALADTILQEEDG